MEEKPKEKTPEKSQELPAKTLPEFDPKKAQELIEEDKAKRKNSCTQEINALLEKYDCKIDVQMLLAAGSILPQVNVVAN